jgi:AraC-like DNA-binding protein
VKSGELSESWRHELGTAFAGLAPQPMHGDSMTGRLRTASLGDVVTYRVSGTPQVVRRSTVVSGPRATGPLKMCLQVRGGAVLHQQGRELRIGVGQLAVYDTGLPYDLRLDGDWECDVMTFPVDSLALPTRWVRDLMGHTHDAHDGPGSVLRSFIDTSLRPGDAATPGAAQARFGDAGISLLASALTQARAPDVGAAPDAVRLQVTDYLRRHVADPGLTHASIAAAHSMSARTLDRLFAEEPRSVTAALRVLRLEGARRELGDPRSRRYSINAIAASWCFVDPAHFSRAFKAHFGLSPSETRTEAATPPPPPPPPPVA